MLCADRSGVTVNLIKYKDFSMKNDDDVPEDDRGVLRNQQQRGTNKPSSSPLGFSVLLRFCLAVTIVQKPNDFQV